jgi:hypothetical protein
VSESTSYAAEVARLLWPEPWDAPYVTRSRHRPGQPHRDAYLFPNERRPRLLVPADLPGSSNMLRRLAPRRTGLGAVRGLLERSVQSRAFSLVGWPILRVPGTDPTADSIETHLAGCFGRPVRVGVMLGTRRVNQKPVLQVFDTDGGLLGYAKVGHNDLTAALVRHEADSLTRIAQYRPQSFRAPRLIHHGHWSGLEIIAISPLVGDARTPLVPRSARARAMREVALLGGTTRLLLTQSGFWRRLRHDVAALSDAPAGERLARLVGAIEDVHRGDLVTLGGWHGDWSRWNMNVGGGVVQIWDWERYDADVPVGFDGLHFVAHAIRPGHGDLQRQEQTFLRSVPSALDELGVQAAERDLTLHTYLFTIAVRYVDALTHSATPALERRLQWALSLLERQLERTRA